MSCVDCDWGVGIIEKGQQKLIELEENFTYEYLEKNRANALNLMSVNDFLIKYNNKKIW